MRAFSCERYLGAQIAAFQGKLQQAPKGGRVYIEFGGKALDDQHAKRVLPGYHPDLKLSLLRELQGSFSVTVAVAARDLLKPRIRGDSQLFYDRETVSLIHKLHTKGVCVSAGVVTMVAAEYPPEDADRLEDFFALAKKETGISFIRQGLIPTYPHLSSREDFSVWDRQERLPVAATNTLVFSPGGGSGKFGVCVSELYRDYCLDINSFYIKFETFPVFDLPVGHPVNRAFIAATADLGNLVQIEDGGEKTTYDKDRDNFALLCRMHALCCPSPTDNPITTYSHPSDMGINKLVAGFVCERAIKRAALLEIGRRIRRYKREMERGIEFSQTLTHLQQHAT